MKLGIVLTLINLIFSIKGYAQDPTLPQVMNLTDLKYIISSAVAEPDGYSNCHYKLKDNYLQQFRQAVENTIKGHPGIRKEEAEKTLENDFNALTSYLCKFALVPHLVSTVVVDKISVRFNKATLPSGTWSGPDRLYPIFETYAEAYVIYQGEADRQLHVPVKVLIGEIKTSPDATCDLHFSSGGKRLAKCIKVDDGYQLPLGLYKMNFDNSGSSLFSDNRAAIAIGSHSQVVEQGYMETMQSLKSRVTALPLSYSGPSLDDLRKSSKYIVVDYCCGGPRTTSRVKPRNKNQPIETVGRISTAGRNRAKIEREFFLVPLDEATSALLDLSKYIVLTPDQAFGLAIQKTGNISWSKEGYYQLDLNR